MGEYMNRKLEKWEIDQHQGNFKQIYLKHPEFFEITPDETDEPYFDPTDLEIS